MPPKNTKACRYTAAPSRRTPRTRRWETRVCPDGGLYQIEVLRSGTPPITHMSIGMLFRADGLEEGQFVALVMREPQERRAKWSENLPLEQGACYPGSSPRPARSDAGLP